jgi:hypothetical protein
MMQVRSLCCSRQPYPALLLSANVWPAVDVLYGLPGIPMLFQVRCFVRLWTMIGSPVDVCRPGDCTG